MKKWSTVMRLLGGLVLRASSTKAGMQAARKRVSAELDFIGYGERIFLDGCDQVLAIVSLLYGEAWTGRSPSGRGIY